MLTDVFAFCILLKVKRSTVNLLLWGLPLTVIVIFGYRWLNRVSIAFHRDLRRLEVSASGTPAYDGKLSADFGANTFTDEVSSETIADLYYSACERLEDIRGSHPRKTWVWYDDEGWPRVSSVVLLPAAHIKVTASENNDNDAVYVSVTPGPFPPPDHSPRHFLAMKELPNDRLPAVVLRFQWKK